MISDISGCSGRKGCPRSEVVDRISAELGSAPIDYFHVTIALQPLKFSLLNLSETWTGESLEHTGKSTLYVHTMEARGFKGNKHSSLVSIASTFRQGAGIRCQAYQVIITISPPRI